ncbi:MAG TPA: altronate dehydratase family protein [Solirubrobacteraceae bacterium]|nr:altronate dehydratase family protein [Solirubrobacteraceae bacterium]
MSTVQLSDAVLALHPDDSVALARRGLQPGDEVAAGGERVVLATAPVPRGHKVALVDLSEGSAVRKYGQTIGIASRPIAAGDHVHEHNLVSAARAGGATATAGDAPAAPAAPPAPAAPSPAAGSAAANPPGAVPTFDGIVRPDGRVGTRNYVAVLSTVNCSATVVRRIVSAFSAPGALDEHPGVDGVIAITHGTGCGLSADGEGLKLLRRTLAGYARHPNVGGVVVVGLGCEVNQIAGLVDRFDLPDSTPVRHMTIQHLGGSVATVRAGVEEVSEMLRVAGTVQRRAVPASALMLGLNCGGSDAWSGVSANPVLGIAVDRLVACGGTAVLAETPEIHGAEHLLTSRAASPAIAQQLLDRVAWWERYAAAEGGNLNNNPSPGNRAGGVTTIEEKSLGAVAKGGSSPLRAVVGYAEPVTEQGLVFMDTPGYDPVSVTGIVAGGANVVCFTTGRGSVFGCKPAPSLKLATTEELYRRMPDDMDVNCGPVLDGRASVSELGEALFDEILAVASGQRTKSEELDFGDQEFTPWQLGAVM